MIENYIKKRIFTSLILLSLLFIIFISNFALIYSLIVIGIFSILEFQSLIKKIHLNKIIFLVFNFIFISYIFTFCFLFFYLSNFFFFKVLLHIFILGCVASDIGGYMVGRFFKGPKLTKISPNKTYAGSIGSLIFTIILISFSFYIFLGIFNYKVIVLSFIVSIFCQIGDLIFSFFKRKAKTKDTGKILPGHGGILDRIDGILLGVPFGFLFFTIFLNEKNYFHSWFYWFYRTNNFKHY